MKRKKFVKRALSFFLALLMTLSYIPEIAYAYSVNDGTGYSISSDNVQFNDDASNDIDDVQISESNNDVSGEDASETISDNKPDNEEDDSNIQDDQEEQDDSDVDEVIEDDSISENDIDEESISENVAELEELEPVGNDSYKVRVSYPSGIYEYDENGNPIWSVENMLFDSIDEAFGAFYDGTFITENNDSPITGRYEIILKNNEQMTEDFIIPSYVRFFNITSEYGTEIYSLDMNGHTIKTGDKDNSELDVYINDVKIVSNADESGSIELNFLEPPTGNDVFGKYLSVLPENIICENGTEICLFDNIEIRSPYVYLRTKENNKLVLNDTIIETASCSVAQGKWTIKEINADWLSVNCLYEENGDGTYSWTKATLVADNVTSECSLMDWSTFRAISIKGEATIKNLTLNEARLSVEKAYVYGISENGTGIPSVFCPFEPSLDVDNITLTKGPSSYASYYDSETNSDNNYAVQVNTGCKLSCDSFDMKAGTFCNRGSVNLGQAYVQDDLILQKGSSFTVDDISMGTRGEIYFNGGCTLNINSTATLYNPYFENIYDNYLGEDRVITINRKNDTSVTFNGNACWDKDFKMLLRTVDNNGSLIGTPAGTKVFSASFFSLIIDNVSVEQTEEFSEYDVLIAYGSDVVVGKKSFIVGTVEPLGPNEVYTPDREFTELDRFVKWSDAVTYIDSLNNTNVDYAIMIEGDTDNYEALTLPKNVKSFKIISSNFETFKEEDERPYLSFIGNITLNTDLIVEGVILKPIAKNGDVYIDNTGMTVSLNGKCLYMSDSEFYSKIASVTGTGNSSIYLMRNNLYEEKPALELTGKFSVPDASISDYIVKASDIQITSVLMITNSTIESDGNISLGTVWAFNKNGDKNIFVTGNLATNKVTISNTVKTGYPSTVADVTILGAGGDGTDTAQLNVDNVISLRSKYIEDQIDKGNGISYGDFTDHTLVTGAKVPASLFVIGFEYDYYFDEETYESEYTNCTADFLTQKSGNDIKVSAVTPKAVTLYTTGFFVDEYCNPVGSYETLADAIAEIDKLANATAEYEIRINPEDCETVTVSTANFTMPKATSLAALTIKSATAEPVAINLLNALPALTCDLTLENVNLVPSQGKLSMSLNKYALTLKNTDIDGIVTGITGGSATGTSCLNIIDTNATAGNLGLFEVNGKINNVGTISLDGIKLSVTDTVNIGDLTQAGETGAIFEGTVKITQKNNEITATTPNITINGKISGDKLKIGALTEKTVDGVKTYVPVEEYGFINYSSYATDTGIIIAKALKTDPDGVKYVTGTGMMIKKSGNLVYINRNYVPYILEYDDNTIPCLTFADVVTEINNINNKNNYYTVVLRADANGDVNVGAPEAFTMPATAKLAGLTITSNSNVNLYYGTAKNGKVTAVSKLAFTTDTIISNVTFIDAEASVNMTDVNYPYRAALNISLGGKQVSFENVVFEGRGVIIDGGRTGVLTLVGDTGLLAGYDVDQLRASYDGCNVIEGEFKNMSTVYLDDNAVLLMKRYISDNKGTTRKDASMNLSTFAGFGNTVHVEGSITLKDITSNYDANQNIIIADRAFTISGTVFAGAENNLVLIGRQKNDNALTPFLSITGTFNAESYPIAVGIMAYDINDYDLIIPEVDTPVSLLSASKCNAADFVTVVNSDYAGDGTIATIAEVEGFNPDSDEAQRGIGLIKDKTLIRAYDGSYIHLALVAVENEYEMADVAGDAVIGYYNSIPEAMSAINTINDKTVHYTIILLDDIGNSTTTVTIPATAKTAGISFQGYGDERVLTLKTLVISNNLAIVNLKINIIGNVTTTKNMTLTLNNGSVLSAKGTVTLENIINREGNNRVEYTRTAKDANQLKINGRVTNYNGGQLAVKMTNEAGNEYTVAEYTVENISEISKPANKQLFVAPLVTVSDIKIMIGTSELNESYNGTSSIVVKSKDGFYYLPSGMQNTIAALGYGDSEPNAYYIDMNQALYQIKAIADRTADYTVYIDDTIDVNVIDTVAHSKIEMPTTNTARSIKITGFDGDETDMYFSGDISAFVAAGGSLTFEGIKMVPVAAADKNGVMVNSETSKITLGRNGADKSGEVTLNLIECSIEGYLNQIVGTKNVTDVYVDSDITLKAGFTNVYNLTVDGTTGATVIAGGNSTVGNLYLKGSDAGFVSLGTATVDTIKIDSNLGFEGPWIGAAGPAKFKINKTVESENTKVLIRLLDTSDKTLSYATINDESYLADEDENYLDKDLIYAPLADTSVFTAYPYGETEGKTIAGDEPTVSYKNGNNIRIGNKAEMVITVEADGLFTYAKDYAEAIKSINTWKNKTDYTITFLSTGAVTTTAAGKDPGAFTYPAAANASSLTIKGTVDGINITEIQFTGAIKPAVDTTFENVVLNCGKIANKAFIELGEVALDLGTASLDMGNAITKDISYGQVAQWPDLFVSSIKGTKGTLTLRDCTVYADSISMGTLNVMGTVDISTRSAILQNYSIGSIYGTEGDDKLFIDAPKAASPMLKVTGYVRGMEEIGIRPVFKDTTIGHNRYYRMEELDGIVTNGTETTAVLNKMRLADMAKVPTDIVNVYTNFAHSEKFTNANINKVSGFIYLTSQIMSITVTDENDYSSQFVSFMDAVTDIDKIADKTADYQITLKEDTGRAFYYTSNEIKAVTLPKNAASVTVKGENVEVPGAANDIDGDGKCTLYTSGTSLVVNIPTTFENISVRPVKKTSSYKSGNTTMYYYSNNTSGLAINIGNNTSLELNEAYLEYFINKISGGSLDVYGSSIDDYAGILKNITVKNLHIQNSYVMVRVAKATITCQTSGYIKESNIVCETGNISLKDTEIIRSSIEAANINLTGITTLNETVVSAIRDKTVGQGKISMANVALEGEDSTIQYKQDKAGKPMLTISGTVISDGAKAILGLYYSNSDYKSQNNKVIISVGTIFATAAKVTDVSVFGTENNFVTGCSMMKSGNNIVYSRVMY